MLVRPAMPLAWPLKRMLTRPEDIMAWDMDAPEIMLLSYLNVHPRDRHIIFYADTHKYLVDGLPTRGSVTGLVHAFSAEFDGQTVIQNMMHGPNWPRPGCALMFRLNRCLYVIHHGPYSVNLSSTIRPHVSHSGIHVP